MTFQEFLVKIGLSEFSFWGIMLFLTTLGIELTPRIKWNPWTALFKWIGERFNTHIDAKLNGIRGELNVLDQKVANVQDQLGKHISESEQNALRAMRRDILEFCNACMNGRKHTREQYEFMIKQCDTYEEFIRKNYIKNGVIEAAITEIRRLYQERLHKNDFLREGEDPEEYIRKNIIDEVVAELHKLYDGCPARKKSTTSKARSSGKTVTKKVTIKKTDEEGETQNE